MIMLPLRLVFIIALFAARCSTNEPDDEPANIDQDCVDDNEDFIEEATEKDVAVIDIPKDGLKVGLVFENEASAVDSILNWGRKSLCPLMKSRRTKTAAETEGATRGRRTLQCPHGIYRKLKSENRPTQHVKFTKCPCVININEQEDGSFVITKAILEHFGHIVSEKDYYSHEHTKRLSDKDKIYVKGLIKGKAHPKNIASCLSERTGRSYSTQDLRNIIKSIEENSEDKPKVDEVLIGIEENGGINGTSKML